MLEQGGSQRDISVWVGLVLGLAAVAVWKHQRPQPRKIGAPLRETRQHARSARLLAVVEAVALATTKARLWLWKYVPSRLRPWACGALGTRYSPASKVNRMFTLRYDNNSEKLRWVLELAGEEFHEVPVAVFLAKPTAIYHSLGDSGSLPIVSTSEGRGGAKTVPAVLEHLSRARWRAWMYPEGAHELEQNFEQDFGAAAMSVAFAYLCQKEMRLETIKMLAHGIPLWQRLLLPMLWDGVFKNYLRTTGSVSANIRVIERTFGLVESILSDGRPYLCGSTISVADIAFASLAFPVILPEETSSVFVAYDPRSLPRGYVEIIKSLRSREGGMFVLRLYRRKRMRSGGSTAASPVRTPRRGRSFTLKKNVNSPSPSMSRQGDRRATITHARSTAPLAPAIGAEHRSSFAA